MNKQIERFKHRMVCYLNECDQPDEVVITELDVVYGKVFTWLFRNVMPALLIAVIADIAIMFSVPVEFTMYESFWLKDPLSIAIGFIIAGIVRKLFKNKS